MWFGILGPVEARQADGNPVTLGGPKVRVLLALLLADVGRVVSTDRLIDGLYADDPPERAGNALQSQVSRLRRSLGSDIVELHPAGYRLAVDPSDVDAAQFEALAAQGRRALNAGDPGRASALLGEALALWRGPIPAELDARRLDELRLAATEDHIEAQLALGTAGDLVPRLQELITAHPLRERFRGQLMRALASSGRQAEALTAFEDARRTLADELGSDPSAELTETHVSILKGQTEPVTAHSVPAQLTSFVGRGEELARVAALLAGHRLVTLTGPGGTGKTRLAVESAGQVGGSVCFVEFAPLTDSEDVPQAVLAALGLREPTRSYRPAAPPVDRLLTALADRPMLLVFDNCEHVIDAVAQLAARLLATHSSLRVLATSREPLGITGEALYPVPRLAAAPPDADLVSALGFPAVRLFSDRASTVRADFRIDDGNLPQVLRICQALDGLPLAIELAAARVRSLSVDEIAARLDDRFGLLSRGSRTAEPRHRTLRAVVEWSWDLLDPEERTLARRLTVFAGSATLAGAQQVCGLPDAADVMAGLVDKSLVEVTGDRYRMLETIRAFCAEQLEAETEQVRRAHADYFLAMATEADGHLLAAEQLVWLDRLESEHDNLHAALRWAVEVDVPMALRLVSTLSTYWWMRGRRFDGAQLCIELAAKIGPAAPVGMAEEFALCVINALSNTGDEPLKEHLAAVKAWAAKRDAPAQHPFATVLLAPVIGPPTPEVAAKLIGATPDPWSKALEPLGRSYQELFDGNVSKARASLTTALKEFRAIGERWGIMQTLSELATILSWQGEHDRAITLLDEAVSLVGELGAADDLVDMLGRRAECLLRAGDSAGARAGYQHLVTLGGRMGALGLVAGAHLGLATVLRQDDDPSAARRLCELALKESGSGWFGPDWTRSQIFVALGRIACAEGNPTEATSWLARAIEDSVSWGNVPLAAAATEAMADVALLAGEPLQAARLLGAGVALRGTSVAGDSDVARVSAAATALIGPDAFSVGYAEGTTMGHGQALKLSRSSHV